MSNSPKTKKKRPRLTRSEIYEQSTAIAKFQVDEKLRKIAENFLKIVGTVLFIIFFIATSQTMSADTSLFVCENITDQFLCFEDIGSLIGDLVALILFILISTLLTMLVIILLGILLFIMGEA